MWLRAIWASTDGQTCVPPARKSKPCASSESSASRRAHGSGLHVVALGKMEGMSDLRDLLVRVAGTADAPALAELRALWVADIAPEPDFAERVAAWLAAEGERRTTWLAVAVDGPV